MSAENLVAGGEVAVPAARGVIHDRGYRRYEGPRLGRLQIARALCWHSFRSAFGIGRGAKAKILPVIAFIAICLPAVVNAFSMAKTGTMLESYGLYSFPVRVIVLTIFVAVQAPELLSRDLRSRVLPLYFSRPMRRGDYPAAKYLAFMLACLVMVEVPLLLLYLGTIVSTHGSGAVWDQTKAFGAGLAVGLLWAVLVSAIGLALASLTGRRAYATGIIAIFFFLTYTLAQIMQQIAGHGAGGPVVPGGIQPAGQRTAGLISPFTVIEGIRQWFHGAPHVTLGTQLLSSSGPVPYPGSEGPVYLVMFLVLLAASFTILAVRYRKAAAV